MWLSWPKAAGVWSGGLLRGFVGIGIGYLLAQIPIKTAPKNIKRFIGISAIEIVVLCYAVGAMFWETIYISPLCLLCALTALVWLFVKKEGGISQSLDLPVFRKISAYMLAIYVLQSVPVYYMFPQFMATYPELAKNHPITIYLFVLGCCFALGYTAHHLVEKPATCFLTRLFFPNK